MPNASEALNVFYYKIGGSAPSDVTLLDEMETWTRDAWAPDWQDVAVSECELVSGDVDIINEDGTVARNVGAFLVGLSGLATGDIATVASAYYLLAYTIYPKVRGSKYVPGCGEEQINDGLAVVGTVADLAILLVTYFGDYSAASGALYRAGVLSRSLAKFEAFTGSGLINDVPAYQRRRKPFVGS
jgi:hypothetical protein